MKKTFNDLVKDEYTRARSKFGLYNSAHEGLAVMLEEFEELKAEVFKKDRNEAAMLEEVVQLAACCKAFADSLSLVEYAHFEIRFSESGRIDTSWSKSITT
jgi:hypothetical protein